MTPNARAKQLIAVGLAQAQQLGYLKVTREVIARAAQVSPGLVSHRLGTMDQVRRSIMRAAVATQNVAVVAQGLMVKDPYALKAPADLLAQAKEHAISSLMG